MFALEDAVHELEGDAARLWQEEGGPNHRHARHDAKQQERAVLDVLERTRRDECNDKVEEPLAHGGSRHGKRTQLVGCHLGTDRPGDRRPAETVTDDKDVNHGDGEVAHAINRRACRTNGLVDGDPEERKHLHKAADDEAPLSSELLDGHRHEETGGDDLDHAIDARCEQATRLSRDAERLEDLGRVVVDRVGAGELLEEHEQGADEDSVGDDAVGEGHLELLDKRETRLALQILLDLGEDSDDDRVGFVGAVDAGERVLRLCDPVLLHEPSRRLGLEEKSHNKEHAGQALECKWHLPHGARCLIGIVLHHAVVDKVGDADTGHDEQLIHGHHGGSESDPETADDPAYIKLVECCVGALAVQAADGLDDGADEEDGGRDEHGLLSAEAVGQVETGGGTKEAAGLKHRDDVALECCELGIVVLEAEVLLECRHVEHAADESGIPTEKQTSEGGADTEDVDTPVVAKVLGDGRRTETTLCGLVDCEAASKGGVWGKSQGPEAVEEKRMWGKGWKGSREVATCTLLGCGVWKRRRSKVPRGGDAVGEVGVNRVVNEASRGREAIAVERLHLTASTDWSQCRGACQLMQRGTRRRREPE
ncbi:hypothetical protein L1887_61614 [Cichorium endivia]|nr:hypothetical protein L1887_61614 [Cichorium endivia]